MKTETSIKGKKFIYNISKPEILDDFWKDCIEQKNKKYLKNNTNAKYIQKSNNLYINIEIENDKTNSQSKNKNIKSHSSSKLIEPKTNNNKNKINLKNEKYLIKIYKKHPSFIEEIKNEEIKKIKRKNALNRCLGLFSYGLELQKNLKLNKENNEIQKKKNDILLCPFKPKINKKILYLNDDNIIERKYNKINNNNINNNNVQNINSINNINNKDINKNPKKQKVKSVEHARNNNYINKKNDFEECTFKPKLIKNPSKIEKILKLRRKNKKSISERRENEEFILRYTKARDEYLIRRFIKLNKKDDSYDNSLLSLTKRLCNEQYKNYLNVNNTICLFGETINTNTYINSSIADFRGLTIANTVQEKKKKKINYIIGLRKNLHSIDLNEAESEQ